MGSETGHLEDFICMLSIQNSHFVEKPISLSCGHAACFKCLQELKENTQLYEVSCLKCKKENSLEIEYFESDLIKNYMKIFSDKIIEALDHKYKGLIKALNSENKTLLVAYKRINYFIFI